MIQIIKQSLINESDLSALIKDAFLSPPWCEDLSFEECLKRAREILAKRDPQCIVAKVDSNLAGAIITDTLTNEELEKERGPKLAAWASERGWQTIGWGRETLIMRAYQSMGFGSSLREMMIAHLTVTKMYSGILTRMRDDNFRVLKIAEKFGYQRTGVRVKSSLGENIWHEFWYREF